MMNWQIILIFSPTPGVLSGTSVIAKYGTISVCKTNDGQWQPCEVKRLGHKDYNNYFPLICYHDD